LKEATATQGAGSSGGAAGAAWERALVLRAVRAAARSYSPYSRFPVGAAVLTSRRRVFTGCNIENASYGLTLCAERAAVVAAAAAGERRLRAVAVAGGRGTAARPCGACLQVLAEFAGPDLVILLAPLDAPERVERMTLAECLPRAFVLAGRRSS
jgi:cytidine deaminase